MMTYDTAFARELAKLINQAIISATEILTGRSIGDYAEYKYRLGQIDALKAVLESFDEAEDNANKR